MGLPDKFEFANYISVIRSSNALLGLWNGVFTGFFVVVISIFIASLASFYIARVNKGFARFSYNYFISGLIIPVAIVPIYLELRLFNMTNTYTSLILLFVTAALPFSIFLFTGFIKTVTTELDEAAIIDGCSPLSSKD